MYIKTANLLDIEKGRYVWEVKTYHSLQFGSIVLYRRNPTAREVGWLEFRLA